MANGRCYLHGGRRKGGSKPGQPTHQARTQWRKNLAIRHAMGLKQPGGSPRRPKTTEDLVAKATRQLEIALLAARPPDRPDMTAREVAALPPAPLPQGASTGELLSLATTEGVKRLYEIVTRPIDWDELKQVRLIGDMSLGVSRLAMRAAEGEFRARRDDALTMLLEEIQRDRALGGKSI